VTEVATETRRDTCVRTFGQVFFGVWAMVALYAMLHDQYIVRIAPEHFTVYHPNPLGIRQAWLRALATAFGASFAPGLMLGLATFVLARVGPWPKVAPKTIFKGEVVVLALTEAAAEVAGWAERLGFGTVFPEAVYQGLTPALRRAQTIQLTCYSAAAIFSVGLLGFLLLRRAQRARGWTRATRD
jgi:hypothetical protein